MISSEAPLLFAKAAQIFITEVTPPQANTEPFMIHVTQFKIQSRDSFDYIQLTLRAWIHTEDSKRRTLQRNDIAMAITKFDQV